MALASVLQPTRSFVLDLNVVVLNYFLSVVQIPRFHVLLVKDSGSLRMLIVVVGQRLIQVFGFHDLASGLESLLILFYVSV